MWMPTYALRIPGSWHAATLGMINCCVFIGRSVGWGEVRTPTGNGGIVGVRRLTPTYDPARTFATIDRVNAKFDGATFLQYIS